MSIPADHVSHFRGHLFADLRGSTAFTQQAGNAAGADLVRRFRQMVRDEVGRHQGAAVKTEGDAIYVVFPSASMAVMCGLALAENAEKATADNPALPIHVGVGIHAGEAVEVPEGGFIGTAVNLAARVCAVAEAGEVLVTGTVREIAQGSVPVTFVSRGKRRLKGIDEQVDLWRVVPAGAAAPAERRMNRRLLSGAGVLGVGALVVLGAVLFWSGGGGSPASPSNAPESTSPTLRIGPLAIGEYESDGFTPPLTMAVTDTGWSLTGQRAASLDLLHEGETPGRLAIARLTGVTRDPCNPDGTYPIPTGASPADLVAALKEVADTFRAEKGYDFLEQMTDAVPIEIDRRPGLRVDFKVSGGVFAACDPGTNGVSIFPLGSHSFAAQPNTFVRLEAIPVDGRTVSFISVLDVPDPPNAQLQTFREIAADMVDGVRFR
jgi:class 3 adenylate cyclase